MFLASNTKWRLRVCMLCYYHSEVCSRLDYGPVVYSSAHTTALIMLDSVHHAFLHLATGAFKPSPIANILVDCSETSLSCMRVHLMMSNPFLIVKHNHVILSSRQYREAIWRPKSTYGASGYLISKGSCQFELK